jgi:nicotinamidase-related amidase
MRLRVLQCVFVLATVLPFGGPAWADDIVTSWNSVHLPPPPALKPVTVDPAHTALLLLDFDTGNCTTAKRPTCFASLPKVAALLAEARKHKMMVAYSITMASSIKAVPEVLAPKGDEPVVKAGVDKFMGTELDAALKAKDIRTVIVTGTAAHGAVLYTASAAALRGYAVAVPVDGLSAEDPFAELAAAWVLVNAPASVSKNMTLTRTDMIRFP